MSNCEEVEHPLKISTLQSAVDEDLIRYLPMYGQSVPCKDRAEKEKIQESMRYDRSVIMNRRPSGPHIECTDLR